MNTQYEQLDRDISAMPAGNCPHSANVSGTVASYPRAQLLRSAALFAAIKPQAAVPSPAFSAALRERMLLEAKRVR